MNGRNRTQESVRGGQPAPARLPGWVNGVRMLGIAVAILVILLLAFQRQELRRETSSLQETTAVLQREAAAVPAGPSSRPPTAGSTSAAEKPRVVPAGALERYSDRNLLGEPEYAAAIARRHRRYALANYRGVFEGLRLPPTDAARLKELIAARWLAGEDVGDVLDRMKGTSMEFRAQARTAATAEIDQKIKELLGPEGTAQLNEFETERSAGTGNWILFTDFWDKGVPLTSEQEGALAHVLGQAGVGTKADESLRTPDPKAGFRPVDLQVLDAAAKFLSPEQLAFFREVRLNDARYAQALRDAAAARAAAKSVSR